MNDLYVIVDHNRHTDDKYTIVKGYDNAKKVAEDLARSCGYVDDDGSIIIKDKEVGYIDPQNNFVFY